MTYRVVYDVLDSESSLQNSGGLRILLVALVFMILLIFVYWRSLGYQEGRPLSGQDQGPRILGGIFFLGLFVLAGAWEVATQTYPEYVEEQRCKEWARSGDYQTAEGPVIHLGKNSFQVGEARFPYFRKYSNTGGFYGKFTAPGTEGLRLRPGLKVRIAHQEGRILRIEIAE
jgi:hypothetical protein